MHERVGAFASGQLHELIRFVLAPVLVNLAAQPIQQGNVGALIHVMERGAQCASCRSKELGRVQVAQGIGRKIAKATHAPVDILEDLERPRLRKTLRAQGPNEDSGLRRVVQARSHAPRGGAATAASRPSGREGHLRQAKHLTIRLCHLSYQHI